MDKLYQLTNKHSSPQGYPVLRTWIMNNQTTLICHAAIKFTAKEINTKKAFGLHVHIIDKQKNKISGLMLAVDSFLDLSEIGFLVAIRAAEWAGGDMPRRFLVEFISLNKKTTLSICK